MCKIQKVCMKPLSLWVVPELTNSTNRHWFPHISDQGRWSRASQSKPARGRMRKHAFSRVTGDGNMSCPGFGRRLTMSLVPTHFKSATPFSVICCEETKEACTLMLSVIWLRWLEYGSTQHMSGGKGLSTPWQIPSATSTLLLLLTAQVTESGLLEQWQHKNYRWIWCKSHFSAYCLI